MNKRNVMLPVVFIVTVSFVYLGDTLMLKDPPRCGDWIPYKDEKCIKIADRAGFQNQQDGEIVCESYSEDLKRESYPKLITIKSHEEQEFLRHFLFVENSIVDNVWLGLNAVANNTDFQWNDGSNVEYTNWAKQNVTDDEHHCVQMTSGKTVYGLGEWVKVHCKVRSLVVCERTQTWTLETLQNLFLNYKLEQERLHEKQKEETRTELMSLHQQLDDLKRNPVPVGFIYVQLAGQQPPTDLWPQTNWTDVTPSYAGLFFRAGGGNAAPFGEVQDENTKRLAEVRHQQVDFPAHTSPLPIPVDGSWSKFIHTGIYHPTTIQFWYGTQFRISTGEERPRNQAVKIWKRE